MAPRGSKEPTPRHPHMGAEFGLSLYRPGSSTIHRLPAHLKLTALLLYVTLVVATPRELVWPYAGHLAVLGVAVAASRVPPSHLLARLVVELPFVVFAVLLPFVAAGPRTTVLGVPVSQGGLEGAWALLAKGTLGVLAALLLAATTSPRDLLTGLSRLRAPRQLVEIAGFMVRYVQVVAGELGRMRVARESRGFSARSPRHWPVLGRTVGTLFLRSYERGERVHLAMLSRGYAGALPLDTASPVSARQYVLAATLPAGALLVVTLSWVLP